MPILRHLILTLATSMLLAGAAHADPDRWKHAWPETDFSKTAVDFDEILSGGRPRTESPPSTRREFLPARDEARLSPREPVLTYAPDGAPARAYPVRYLMWHEIVNDVVAGRPDRRHLLPAVQHRMVFDARVMAGA